MKFNLFGKKEKTFKNKAVTKEGEMLKKPLTKGVKGIFRKAMEILAYGLQNNKFNNRAMVILSARKSDGKKRIQDIAFIKGDQAEITSMLLSVAEDDETFAEILIASAQLVVDKNPSLEKFQKKVLGIRDSVKKTLSGSSPELPEDMPQELKDIIKSISDKVPGAKVKGIDLDDLKGKSDKEIEDFLDKELDD